MNATVIKDGIDRIDTGLPDRPDLASVLDRGRRMRRRRQAVIGLGLAALAAAIAVPAGLLAGGGDGSGEVADDPPSSTATSTQPDPAIASEAFGTAMASRVEALFPGVTQTADGMWDHYEKNGACCVRPAVSDPVDWPHVFSWSQAFELKGSYELFVSSTRFPEERTDPSKLCPAPSSSDEDSCDLTVTGDGRTVVVIEGTQFDDTSQWGERVQVVTDAGPRGFRSIVLVSAVADADTWAEAQSKLPDTETLTDLALDPSLELPEPESIPGFDG